MAIESEDDYVQRRFRETPKKAEGWTQPDVWTRPAQFDGMDGGRDSFSIPLAPSPEPIINGTPTSSDGGALGPIPDVIIDMNGTLYYMDVNAEITGPV